MGRVKQRNCFAHSEALLIVVCGYRNNAHQSIKSTSVSHLKSLWFYLRLWSSSDTHCLYHNKQATKTKSNVVQVAYRLLARVLNALYNALVACAVFVSIVRHFCTTVARYHSKARQLLLIAIIMHCHLNKHANTHNQQQVTWLSMKTNSNCLTNNQRQAYIETTTLHCCQPVPCFRLYIHLVYIHLLQVTTIHLLLRDGIKRVQVSAKLVAHLVVVVAVCSHHKSNGLVTRTEIHLTWGSTRIYSSLDSHFICLFILETLAGKIIIWVYVLLLLLSLLLDCDQFCCAMRW